MRLEDGIVKNILRRGVKILNKGKYDKYVRCIRERSETLPFFSLLTSDCMAGLIYHTMRRQFLSPTINMSIRDSDFLKLLSDFDYYFGHKIEFIESPNYPIGYIGDGDNRIKISFEHYKSEEEASEKWYARKMRMTDNIFVVVADQNLTDRQIEQFRRLEEYLPIKRKVMFTWNQVRADGKEIFCVKPYGRDRIKNWSKIRTDGFRDYEVFFDYVAWMKMEDHFILDLE